MQFKYSDKEHADQRQLFQNGMAMVIFFCRPTQARKIYGHAPPKNHFSEIVFELTCLMQDAGIFISVLPLVSCEGTWSPVHGTHFGY